MIRIGLSDDQRNTLKSFVRAAVKASGGQENARNVTGRVTRAASFSDYGNAAHFNRHMPIDIAVEVDMFNGDPSITRAMAELQGFALIPMPGGKLKGSVLGSLARAVKEAAESISVLSEALSFGGKLLPHLRERAIREVEEAIVAAYEVLARLKAMRDEDRHNSEGTGQ